MSVNLARSRFGFFGVPYDRTCTYKPGSRFGPGAIRDVSANLELYSIRSNVDLETVPIADLGDVDVLEQLPETLARVSSVWSELVRQSKLPIIVGGEHSITKAPFDVIHSDVGIVSFDAHLDLRDEFLGEKLSHATFMRRIAEKIGPTNIMEIGIRAFSKPELDYCKKTGVHLVFANEIHRDTVGNVIRKIRAFASRHNKVYVTVDVDVLDPAFAPGVGNPEPDGISTDDLITMVTSTVGKNTIGFDVVEVCPPLDTGQTAAVAAKIIFEAVAALSAGESQSEA